ncbi:hypothetical protein EN873_24995 [bacterium M00.F.Ca.ET.230.01.1.1]|nr:hypothetical protein EN873_24995 [bacterium M00.F.Ca.ET.230.01.1.1]
MIVVGEYHSREGADLDPGEFICVDFDQGRLYGVRTIFASRPVIVVLKSEEPGFKGPYLLNPQTVGRCLSFGFNWVLEPAIGSELPPGKGHQVPGYLAIYSEDFHVVTLINQQSVGTVSLSGQSANSDAVAYGAFFQSWRIWRSEAEVGAGTPIVTM